jgi:hypothetical protein
MINTYILLAIFPITFLIGRIISKTSEEEIKEIKKTTSIITKILLIIIAYITTTNFLSQITSIIITTLIATYLIMYKQSPKEKVIIAIASSISILYGIETTIILGLIATLLWGMITHKIGERIMTKTTAMQTALFFFMISFKFIVIATISFLV